MMPKVSVLDYGMGNLRSVSKALEKVGADVNVVTEVPTDKTNLLVVPGQGHFGSCVRTLGHRMAEVGDWINQERPFLGICLGLQVLFRDSEEDEAKGLGVLDGSVLRFTQGKVPHMGWNSISLGEAGHRWFEGLEGERFYFVHSYYPAPADPAVVATTTDYGVEFCSAVARGQMLATQFHPEKSGAQGLELLQKICSEVRT